MTNEKELLLRLQVFLKLIARNTTDDNTSAQLRFALVVIKKALK